MPVSEMPMPAMLKLLLNVPAVGRYAVAPLATVTSPPLPNADVEPARIRPARMVTLPV